MSVADPAGTVVRFVRPTRGRGGHDRRHVRVRLYHYRRGTTTDRIPRPGYDDRQNRQHHRRPRHRRLPARRVADPTEPAGVPTASRANRTGGHSTRSSRRRGPRRCGSPPRSTDGFAHRPVLGGRHTNRDGPRLRRSGRSPARAGSTACGCGSTAQRRASGRDDPRRALRL